jgi:nitronate monooxygenase
MDEALEHMLNLLLESERAGVATLDQLAAEVGHAELRRLLLTSREDEAADAEALAQLIRDNGGVPSTQVGAFAAKVAATATLRERLQLLIRGEEWVARKIEEALVLAPPDGLIHACLQRMARRHRFEVEWGRAELIRMTEEWT